MKYLAAYLLAVLGGNATPSASDVTKILSSVESTIDNEKLDKLISELSGKSLDELIATGKSKITAVPTGGSAPVSNNNGPKPAVVAAKEEPKEEEEVVYYYLYIINSFY